jgi:hypothetical protein
MTEGGKNGLDPGLDRAVTSFRRDDGGGPDDEVGGMAEEEGYD